MRISTLAAAAAIALAPLGALASQPYVLDKSHSVIKFSADHLGFSTVYGFFRDFDAEIRFDPEAVETSSIRFVIRPASIDTLWEERDKHLRAADFFDVDNHPEITFVSTSVTPTGGDTARVEGELTMLGQTKPATFEAKLNKMAPSPFQPDKTVAGFTVTGEIDRTAYGMNYAAPAVSAVIPVVIELEMSPAE